MSIRHSHPTPSKPRTHHPPRLAAADADERAGAGGVFRKRGQQAERRCEVTEAGDSDDLPLFAKAAAERSAKPTEPPASSSEDEGRNFGK
jgi:hypothetical protein